MRVLITNAATSLGQALADSLGDAHQVRLTDFEPRFGIQSDLGHDSETDALVKDIDIIVHLAYAPRDGDDEITWLDRNTRGTYNLLLAAAAAEVEHAILLSTLDLFTPYEDDLTVDETWKPLPSCAPAVLGAHLAEFTAREFAHSHELHITIARLGHLVRAEKVADQPYDPMWLDERDAAQAVAQIVQKRPAGQYNAIHIQSAAARARFSVERAKSHLAFDPQYNFEANP
ncbi:MAG: NAD-dependent epimerase/dehydratase family protein [Gemmatimonadetes bacterium]|nr:NAD-dependent epimerase/dehydratase family protein [Gemmatimonadota bacterium]